MWSAKVEEYYLVFNDVTQKEFGTFINIVTVTELSHYVSILSGVKSRCQQNQKPHPPTQSSSIHRQSDA